MEYEKAREKIVALCDNYMEGSKRVEEGETVCNLGHGDTKVSITAVETLDGVDVTVTNIPETKRGKGRGFGTVTEYEDVESIRVSPPKDLNLINIEGEAVTRGLVK